MKKFIKLIALVLTAAMAITLLSSCSDQPASTGEATAKETAEESTAAVTDAVTAEAGEQTTAEEVTTEEETEKETEEAKPQQLYDVYRWDFDDASDMGWFATNKTDITAGEDGTMHLTCKGDDPNITTKRISVSIDCDNVEYIVMRVKNKTDDYTGQIFISTTDSPGPSEAYSYKYDYYYADEDDEWEMIEIDTLEINGWIGTLRELRLDYTNGREGDFYIDYIALQTTDEKKAGAVETEEVTDPRAGKTVVYKWDFTKLTSADLDLASKPSETEEEVEEGYEGAVDTRWHFSNGVEDAYVENGHFVIKIGGQDPFMHSPDIDTPLDCDAITAVVLKVCNKSDMSSGQFFFISDGAGNFSEAASVRFTFEHKGADNDVWEEVVINPKDSSMWTGQLDEIRIDPTEADEGIVLLDSCELYG